MGDWLDEMKELSKRNRKAAKKVEKDFIESYKYHIDVKAKYNEPCDLNGRDLYYGAGSE